MFAVLPLLKPWRGDMRRNPAPYVLTNGLTWSDLGLAQFAKRELELRGIACYVDVIDRKA